MGCADLLASLLRPEELVGIAKVKILARERSTDPRLTADPALSFCYATLAHVSRSFATVIMQLTEELRDAVCVFYLVLRALDTVEDDMSVPVAVKKEVLPAFHSHLSSTTYRPLAGVGAGHERLLLERYDLVIDVFSRLRGEYQTPIEDICRRMGEGMASFLDREVATVADFDLYCHYVAGLVGHGLTRIFAVQLESPDIARDLTTANSMGLFLQKVNILRDYLEDISEDPPRVFWPREVWKQHTASIHDFKSAEHRGDAVRCLNQLVDNALGHLPHVVQYLRQLHEPSVFEFCAVPQVMAIATLAKLYNNPDVFSQRVKIRKGLAARIMTGSRNIGEVTNLFTEFCNEIEAALDPTDPSTPSIRVRLSNARRVLAPTTPPGLVKRMLKGAVSSVAHYVSFNPTPVKQD